MTIYLLKTSHGSPYIVLIKFTAPYHDYFVSEGIFILNFFITKVKDEQNKILLLLDMTSLEFIVQLVNLSSLSKKHNNASSLSNPDHVQSFFKLNCEYHENRIKIEC